MHLLPIGGADKYFVTLGAVATLAMVGVWLGFHDSTPRITQDFEDCVEQAGAGTPSDDERNVMMRACGAQFAGRRKPGGGYTYYDFMQDRSFDIAGPNPTEDERKRIDNDYMVFLDAQRREAISAELAKRRNDELQADLERARQPAAGSTVLTPRLASSVPPPVPVPVKRPLERPQPAHCENGSLSCSWKKFSTAVKNAFASSLKAKPDY